MEAKSDILKNEENILLLKQNNYNNGNEKKNENEYEEEKEKENINKNSNEEKENENKNIIKINIRQELIQNNENKSLSNDYSTFNLILKDNKLEKTENSIVINENTTNFDLYKGLIYMFLSCIFKSIFSILSNYALKYKKDLSSFQLLTFRTYYMMWISITIIYALPFGIFSQKFAKIDKILPVVIRTIISISSISLLIYSNKFIDISDT